MSTLAHPGPVRQSVSKPVTHGCRPWPDEALGLSRRHRALTTHSCRTVQIVERTVDELRNQRDHLHRLRAEVVRRSPTSEDNDDTPRRPRDRH